MNTKNVELSALKVVRPRLWEREVRSKVRQSPSLKLAAEALRVSRETLRRWCRELGIPDGKAGRLKGSK